MRFAFPPYGAAELREPASGAESFMFDMKRNDLGRLEQVLADEAALLHTAGAGE
jgi:hypothetical protein